MTSASNIEDYRVKVVEQDEKMLCIRRELNRLNEKYRAAQVLRRTYQARISDIGRLPVETLTVSDSIALGSRSVSIYWLFVRRTSSCA